jgi:hypothetical protein
MIAVRFALQQLVLRLGRRSTFLLHQGALKVDAVELPDGLHPQ